MYYAFKDINNTDEIDNQSNYQFYHWHAQIRMHADLKESFFLLVRTCFASDIDSGHPGRIGTAINFKQAAFSRLSLFLSAQGTIILKMMTN